MREFFFKDRSPLFYWVLFIGILIGIGLNYSIKTISEETYKYLSLVENIRYKTDVQQPVVKAFRLKEYYKYDNKLFMKFEFIKIRECNAPISVTFTYTDENNNAKVLEKYDVFDREGNLVEGPRIAKVDPEHWQETNWFAVDLLRNINIFISTTHACSLKFYDETQEPKLVDGDISTAIDIVTKVYGPFYISDPQEKNLNLSNYNGPYNRHRVSSQNISGTGAFYENEQRMEVPLSILRGLSER